MNLNQKWKTLRNQANTENVLMTVSNIIKFYERGRIDINPSYQRSYRWSNEQKTKFIESLLLKYPIPPIITIKTENEEGLYNYEIIDGVQRLSTIFEFVEAKYKDKNGEMVEIKNQNEKLEKLEGANEFVDINGKDWEDFKSQEFDFIFEASTLLFINLTTNQEEIKYEMFERLNSLSTKLEPQEIRNSILALKDRESYIEISEKVLSMSKNIFGDADISKRLDMEYFLEFSLIKRYSHYSEEIEERIKNSIKANSKKKDSHFDLFLGTYSRIVTMKELLEDLVDYEIFLEKNRNLNFKKYDLKKSVTNGAVIKLYFEILGFLFFKSSNKINEEFYRMNFTQTYTEILSKKLNVANPNAKIRFEIAKKVVENYDGHNLFNN